jgi:hypothetical protein
MNITAWLMALAGPLVKNALIALGFSLVTYVGVSELVDNGLAAARSEWSGAAGQVAAFLALAGMNKALGIISAALSARVTLMVTKKFMPT